MEDENILNQIGRPVPGRRFIQTDLRSGDSFSNLSKKFTHYDRYKTTDSGSKYDQGSYKGSDRASRPRSKHSTATSQDLKPNLPACKFRIRFC